MTDKLIYLSTARGLSPPNGPPEGIRMAKALLAGEGFYSAVKRATRQHWDDPVLGDDAWTVWLLMALTGNCKSDYLGYATCALRLAIANAQPDGDR